MKAVPLVVLMLSSVVAHAQPPESTEAPRWSDPKLIVGASLLAGGYAQSIVWAASGERDQDMLYVPILGPWLELFTLPDCPNKDPYCEHDGASRALLTVDGVAQLGGAALLTMWLLDRPEQQNKLVHVVPASSGVVVFGRF